MKFHFVLIALCTFLQALAGSEKSSNAESNNECVVEIEDPTSDNRENPYESKKLLAEYLLFHFGKQEEILPWEFGPSTALNFPVRTVSHFTTTDKVERSLDLGCSVGRSTFELSKTTTKEVIGIDYSYSFIDTAKRLEAGEVVQYEIRWRFSY